MDGPVLPLPLYAETIIPFLVCGCLHMTSIIIYHTIFSITARPLLVLVIPVFRHRAGSGCGCSAKSALSLRHIQQSNVILSSFVGSQRGDSDCVPVDTVRVAAICTLTKRPVSRVAPAVSHSYTSALACCLSRSRKTRSGEDSEGPKSCRPLEKRRWTAVNKRVTCSHHAPTGNCPENSEV